MENQESSGMARSCGAASLSTSGGVNWEQSKSMVHYDKTGVFIRFEYASEEFPEDDSYVRGAVTITEQYLKSSRGSRKSKWILSWAPRQEDEDWLMIQSMIGGSSPNSVTSQSVIYNNKGDDATAVELTSSKDGSPPQQSSKPVSKVAFSIDVELVTEIRKVNPGVGYPVLALFGQAEADQPVCPLLEFHDKGVKELFGVLKKFMSIKKSKMDENVWHLTPRGHDWSQSLSALNMGFPDPTYIAGVHSGGAYDMTVDGLSRVKNYVFDNLLHQKKIKKTRPREECVTDEDVQNGSVDDPAALLAAERFGINNRLEPGYDMITCVSVGERPHLRPERAPPIDEMEYAEMIDVHGIITDPQKFLNRVFEGGVIPALRPTLWKYLLGYYSYQNTLEQNFQHHKQKEDEYFRMKLQWKTFSQEQLKCFTQLREKQALIEKDVIRTDRTDDFFKGTLDNNVNLCKLYDILMTYCMYNFDLGYLQGMSDLLAPLLMIMEDEVDTFWCFVGLMKLTGSNFDMDDEKGMKLQLSQLKYLLNLLDPSFYAFLESKDSGNLYFCFRWLLIWFKREFSFCDICSLWEVLWTRLPSPNFHLFICLSMLDLEKSHIMAKDFEFTEILKHINELQLKMSVTKVLRNAEAIFSQVKQIEAKLPQNMKHILTPVDQLGTGYALNGTSCEEDEIGELVDSVGPVTCLLTSVSFSEMYKSVISPASPSLIVPPMSDNEDTEMLTL
ncbi:TBC1 domain family member 17-like isoform X3 [Convolutriloba macropyga]|uniref:TBC1 domain family member 17-like isoform X3 n=1 Tax=Convolutriloba macropyga TaxID=536237 RepID=UPI003F51B33B